MSHGIVVGRFCPPHAGHDLVIEAALSACERVTVVLLGRSDEPIPVALRHAWLEELHPGARVAPTNGREMVKVAPFPFPSLCTLTVPP